jgi:hypothetical protein
MQPWTVEWELSPEGGEQLFGPLEDGERAYREAAWKAPEREGRGRKEEQTEIWQVSEEPWGRIGIAIY